MERNAFFKWITSHRSSRFIQIQEQGKDELPKGEKPSETPNTSPINVVTIPNEQIL